MASIRYNIKPVASGDKEVDKSFADIQKALKHLYDQVDRINTNLVSFVETLGDESVISDDVVKKYTMLFGKRNK